MISSARNVMNKNRLLYLIKHPSFCQKLINKVSILLILMFCMGIRVVWGVQIQQPIAISLIAPKTPVAEKYEIDGVIDFSRFSPRHFKIKFQQNQKAANGKLVFDNDDRHLYFAIEWEDPTHNNQWFKTPTIDFDEIRLLIDENGNGTHDLHEDLRFMLSTQKNSVFRDSYFDPKINNPYDLKRIHHIDKVGDGLSRMIYNPKSKTYQAEFLVPMADDIHGEDTLITDKARFQVVFWDRLRPKLKTVNEARLFAKGKWGTIPLVNTKGKIYNHPKIPSNLAGLIVFTSEHDHPLGEIYTFDPRTKKVSRITNNKLHENNVSLSNDRKRIAFHGQTNKSDLSTMEIYTVNVNGSNLKQLTNDKFANAHPAWSPDDSKICYSPIYHPNKIVKASVVIMTSSGKFISNITPPGIEDGDAEYLSDGRIVAKTDRWSKSPELRIGILDTGNGDTEQLTFMNKVSDHDPEVGHNQNFVIFERFMAAEEFTTSPNLLTAGWDIVEVDIHTNMEKTLLADGWINTLPVYDPTGNYIVFHSGPHYFEAILMTRDGKILGRLIPNITDITYIDWK